MNDDQLQERLITYELERKAREELQDDERLQLVNLLADFVENVESEHIRVLVSNFLNELAKDSVLCHSVGHRQS